MGRINIYGADCMSERGNSSKIRLIFVGSLKVGARRASKGFGLEVMAES